MIRSSTPADLPAVYSLICRLEEQQLDRQRFEEIYLAQCRDGGWHGLVWEEDSRVLAWLNLRLEQQLHHAARVAEVVELVVAPALRGRGIGTQLMQAAECAARRQGCVRLEVACGVRRQDAHRFYRRCGLGLEHYRFGRELP